MADEMLPNEEGAPAPETPSQSAAAEAPAAAPEGQGPEGGWSGALVGLALLAVILTLVGIFGQMQRQPNHLPLGLGLILWGILDLMAQRRGLVVWRGAKAVVGNAVNLGRGLSLLGVGAWLCLMAAGLIRAQNTAVVTTVGISLLVTYLGIALALEAFVKGVKLSGQAFLLVALALMFVSYLYFSIPFTFTWAIVFALLAFVAAAWAGFNGAIDQNPALTRAVLLVVLLLGTPLCTFAVQQMFYTEEQPLFTPTLLIPRMREVVAGLGEDAGQIKWAPVHTQVAQPGDVPFSDKIAFTDWRDDKPGVGLFQQLEDGKGQLSWVFTGEDPTLTAFSDDGSRLAFTQVRPGAKSPSLAVLEPAPPLPPAPAKALTPEATPSPSPAPTPATPSEKHSLARRMKDALAALLKAKPKAEVAPEVSAFALRNLYSNSVAPGPEHGQVWRGLGKQLYFAAPEFGLKQGSSQLLRADLSGREVLVLRPGRGLPAISADGKSLLSVGFERDARYLEMADGLNGDRNKRHFDPAAERAYFPAWNAEQTRTLFVKNGRLMIMHSNGTQQAPFNPQTLESRIWYTHANEPFTLQWKNSGDLFRVYRSRPDGDGETVIYTAAGKAVSAPQWSPDAKRVALIVTGDEGSFIVTVGSDGSWPRRFFDTTDGLRELAWSPDGSRVAWICDRRAEKTQEIWTAGYEGLDPDRLFSSEGHLAGLSWSQAGKHLAVQTTTVWTFLGLRLVKPDLNNVVMLDLTDHHARYMTRYGIMARQPAFSPQGVAIAYFTDQRPWAPGFLRERSSSLVISQLY